MKDVYVKLFRGCSISEFKRGEFYLDNVDFFRLHLPLIYFGKEDSFFLCCQSSWTLRFVHDSILNGCTSVGVTSLRGEKRQDDTRGTHKADARCQAAGDTRWNFNERHFVDAVGFSEWRVNAFQMYVTQPSWGVANTPSRNSQSETPSSWLSCTTSSALSFRAWVSCSGLRLKENVLKLV